MSMNTTTPREPSGRADHRREREAEALRANLRKRKEQQRARETLPVEKTVVDTPASESPAREEPGVAS